MGLTTTMRELTTGAEVWSLGAAWDELLARSVSNVFFLTRDFQRIWWEELGVGELRVLVGPEQAGQLRFVAPLYVEPTPEHGRTVNLIGGREVADYLDILAAPDDLADAWRAVFEHLRATSGTWDALELRALPEASPSRSIVGRLATEYGWSASEAVDNVCPLIRLAPTWPAYLAGLRKKDRHELRRKTGRLEQAPAGEHFALLGPDDALGPAIDDFFSLHQLSGQDKAGFWNERMVRFFRRLIETTHANGQLRLAFQSVGGRRVACVLAFRYGDRYYVYNSGYDPAYRDLAVGVVCMGRAIAAAIAEGVAIFDLLQGDESYKYDYGAVNTSVYRWLVRPATR